MSDLVERVRAIYGRYPNCIFPYIGSAFVEPQGSSLRIMAVGINAHSEDAHHGTQPPELYAQWFEKQAYRYQRGVWRDLKDLGARITRPPYMFAGLTFSGMGSIFLTNAVKVYVRDSEGRRADQLTEAHFTAHLDQWRDELDAMADAGLLPHVLAIVGDPFWKYACDSFRLDPPFRRFTITSYRRCKGKALHFANRISIQSLRGRHELLLVRLRHPAGRTPTGAPRWLFEQSDFQEVATCASGPVMSK